MHASQPRRTCVGCRREDDQGALRRFVLRDGVVVADPGGNAPGRGAWLHPDRDCLVSAARRGGFARSFRRSADPTALMDTSWPEAASAR